jgi:hypothetical protein
LQAVNVWCTDPGFVARLHHKKEDRARQAPGGQARQLRSAAVSCGDRGPDVGDQRLDPRLVGREPEDGVMPEHRARDHLGDDERIDVRADLAALDAGAQHRLDAAASRPEDPLAERLEQPGLALVLDHE